MRKKITIITFLLTLIPFLNVNAKECTTSELKRLREIANNVTFTYDYEIVDDKMFEDDEYVIKTARYSITATNFSDELKIKVLDDEPLYFTSINPVIHDFLNGDVVKVEISAYTKNLCSGKMLKNVTIRLPYFNNYSLKEECQEFEDFKYCQEFGKYKISDEKFYLELEKYKKQVNVTNDKDLEDNNNIKFYLMIFVVFMIFVILIILYVTILRKKKESEL